MSLQTHGKLNRVLQEVPKDSVITTARLRELGVSRQLARKYVQNGWLQKLGPAGAFARTGDSPDWLGGIYALQAQLGLTIHVAGVSALELKGRAHFLTVGEGRSVTLLSDRRETLPKWFTDKPWSVEIHHRCLTLFRAVPTEGTTACECGGFSIQVSTPERAILEELHLVRSNSDVEHAILLMEGLSTLRPKVVQEMLVQCTSVKAKRLFLWSAKQNGHTWMEEIDLSGVSLGSGKRQIFKGGILDPKYLITVPEQEGLPSA